MEEVYYLVNKKNSDWIYHSFFLKDEVLKQFSVHTYKNSDSEPINLCIEEDNFEMEVESEDAILDVIFTKSPFYNNRLDEKGYFTVIKSKYNVGIINPKIYRPILQDNIVSLTSATMGNITFNGLKKVKKTVYPPYDKNDLLSSINQLHVLIESLQSIFLTIHPDKENFKAFGHNIRNLLILACTEVESQFRGILKENGCIKKIYNTKDFIKLLEPLRLSAYTLKLVYYPWIDSIDPFSNWTKDKPSESLSWYNNYNAVKHNRAGEFNKGTLKDVIEAISAIAVLLVAQYGDELFDDDSLFNRFFALEYIPKWDISDFYIPPHREDEWKIQKLF